MAQAPVALIILDGWGLRDAPENNAVQTAKTPIFDRIWAECPTTQLTAHGEAVGLRPGLMGNSEVGHLNIGAGRTVWQDITRIDRAIEDESFFCNPAFQTVFDHIEKSNGRLHLIGLTSEGGVHSSEKHYLALIDLAEKAGLPGDRVFFHALTDGRDTPQRSADGYLRTLEQAIKGRGRVASVIGRYYAMDRDRRWERTSTAWRAIVRGEADHTASSGVEAVEAAYARDESDEFILPTVVVDNGSPVGGIQDGDGVIFFNFRADRARQLTQALTDPEFDGFDRGSAPQIAYACMTEYQEAFGLPFAFDRPDLSDLFGGVVSKAGLPQLRSAETEKYAHVTYFFNGGEEKPYAGEDRILIPSPKVPTYDLQPEMSSRELTEAVGEDIRQGNHVVYVVNFANPDMVGHTGVFEAAVAAVEAVDTGLGNLLDALASRDGYAVVTADHGNAELMVDPETGKPHTYHTTSPVPCVLVGPATENVALRDGGALRDLAPTLLDLLGLDIPAAMEGETLISRKEAAC